jgi:hypothetical protein
VDVAEAVAVGLLAHSVIIWRPESCTSARAPARPPHRMALAARMIAAPARFG